MGIVAGREREQADLVVTGALVALERGLDDGLDGSIAERGLDHGALAEAALPRAPPHDLDGDAIVCGLDEGNDWPGWQRGSLEVADHARANRLGHVVRSLRISRIVPSSP